MGEKEIDFSQEGAAIRAAFTEQGSACISCYYHEATGPLRFAGDQLVIACRVNKRRQMREARNSCGEHRM